MEENHQKEPFIKKNESIRKRRQKEQSIVTKIVKKIMIGLVALVVLGSFVMYFYVNTALKPYNANQIETVEIEVPAGSSVSQIGRILEENDIIRSGKVFKYYVKMKNIANFKAGFFEVSPSMSTDQIIQVLIQNGSDTSSIAQKLLIREGEQIKDIAQEIAKVTEYSEEEFLEKIQDETFFNQLVETYPKLLTAASLAENTRYRLEGYLFPATYEVDKHKTLQMIITEMVSKTDSVMNKYYDEINELGTDVHKVLSMASLVEKEGVSLEDRKKIAGVFYNRIDANMMLQTDISILYALGVHKEVVTLEDLKVESPYNLYRNYGVGPGPFNSPSEQAINATIHPIKGEDYYFLADIKTGKVYYAKTYEEHLELKKQFVDGAGNE